MKIISPSVIAVSAIVGGLVVAAKPMPAPEQAEAEVPNVGVSSANLTLIADVTRLCLAGRPGSWVQR